MFSVKWHFAAGLTWTPADKNCSRSLLGALIGAVAVGSISTALAADYDNLIERGYRWVTVDGPYACPTQDDLREIVKNYSDEKQLELAKQLRACSLVEGTIVQVVQNDTASGMSQIRITGIATDLWTLTKFLSRRPVADSHGTVETL
jgi:hypothetical protein